MKYDDDKTCLIDIGQVNRRLAPNYNRFIITESKTTYSELKCLISVHLRDLKSFIIDHSITNVAQPNYPPDQHQFAPWRNLIARVISLAIAIKTITVVVKPFKVISLPCIRRIMRRKHTQVELPITSFSWTLIVLGMLLVTAQGIMEMNRLTWVVLTPISQSKLPGD